jgi:hypothetical protein
MGKGFSVVPSGTGRLRDNVYSAGELIGLVMLYALGLPLNYA